MTDSLFQALRQTLGRIACRLSWHSFASYSWGEVGVGACLRCGRKDYDQ